MAIDEVQLLTRIRRIEDYLVQVGQQIGVPFDLGIPAGVPDEVVDMVRAGDKLRAIKRLTELQGIGLAEAKQIVDGL
ncbi:MAG TPA: hypothetical protein VF549_02620 [Solirubrobacteraceae bacterium]|jgi:hypothetical protein